MKEGTSARPRGRCTFISKVRELAAAGHKQLRATDSKLASDLRGQGAWS